MRFPPPGKGEVSTEGYRCEAGFSSTVVADLQRVFGALEMLRSETDPVDPPLDQSYLGEVAGASSSFSTVVVSPMSAQSEFTRGVG